MKRTKNIILITITVIAALIFVAAGLSADTLSFGMLKLAIPAGIWLMVFTFANTEKSYHEY